MIRSIPAASMLLLATLASANEPAPAIPRLTPPELAISLTETVYIPAQVSLLEHTGRLTGQIAALCATPSSQRLQDSRAAWVSANQAWRRIDAVRMGPSRREDVQNQFDPWPFDEKTVAKKMRDTPQDPTSQPALAASRELKQGLPALEYLLFGNGAPEAAPLAAKKIDAACRYGLWVSAGVARRAQELIYEWQGLRRGLNYDPSYPRPFLSEALTRAVAGLRELAGWKLANQTEAPRRQDFPDWRAGVSKRSLDSGLDMVERTLLGVGGGAGFDDFLATRGKDEAIDGLKVRLANARIAVAGLPDDLSSAEGERRYAQRRLNELADYIAGPLAEALGIPLS
ncbi:imelysin family protein [Chitiniphilus purpureus]|uniref:Imelysin family protein n=1 Tax=Chitiniphilus purpureus TaxID=2981137 RepID=A0ABY6DK68_9NEIS|nr:imelysin family protein [Chitiniphilus sp. CD1]UXY14727.1 imelysin family protein [Chitiniphilus sp. CD1]